MAEIQINDLSVPELEPFREMRHRNWTNESGIFIAEGPLLVERLIRSDYQVHSVLLDRKYYDHYASMVPSDADLLVIDHELVRDVVGFNFHRGVLGCGRRKPERTVAHDLSLQTFSSTETLMGIVGVQDPENLGGILRNCAALGVQNVVLGPGTADPLSRRVLRVSMGNALRLNLFRSRNMLTDLQSLRDTAGVQSIATSLLDGSEPLENMHRNSPVIILMGNEKLGLPIDIQLASDRRVRIDMELGTDSLNVTVAAGIVLHYFCRLASCG